MEASEVSAIIEAEIGDDWERSNAHGVSLARCLVTPVKESYENEFPKTGEFIELWLVLEEYPEDGSGYKIVFDEHTREFGLAVGQLNGPDMFLGIHGSFFETLDAM